LVGGSGDGQLPNGVPIDRSLLDDWRPLPFENGEWLSLRSCFQFASSGLESKRDHIVYAPNDHALIRQINEFLVLDGVAATEQFNSTGMNPASEAKAVGLDATILRTAGYRPLDLQRHYPHPKWNDRLRTQLSLAWGASNICLFSLPSNIGVGPAAWAHSGYPDRHAFRGSYGGYAFPLYDRRVGPDAHNLNPILVDALAEAYGGAQTPEDIFDAILCLLSAQSYTHKFAEDLEDTFPHIPFPADPAVFARAAEVGREIRGLEAFQRDPAAVFRQKAFCKQAADTDDGAVIADVSYRDGELSLWKADGQAVAAFTGLPEAVWSFSVSGYRVLPRWIDGRKGLPFTDALKTELRDVAARIHELIHWFAKADLVLAATLVETVTRAALGFPAPEPGEVDEGDD
ncbi:MAG: hypothetical protein QFC78_03390, partial [Pseudomonadota bacterium]|nr:hypothetical protein [Pseudomonadota bacterium]